MLSFRKSVLTALALSLAVALPVFADQPGETSKAPAPAGFEKYLPDGADSVVKINVRQFLDSELVKKAGLDKAMSGDDAKKMVDTFGFNPIKDVERIIFSSSKDKADDSIVIIQGKFDPAKLAAFTEALAKQKSDYLKVHKTPNGKIYEATKLDELLKDAPPQFAPVVAALVGKSIFFVYPDKGHVVFVGGKESAETVLAKAAGTKKTKVASKELATLIGKINPKQTVSVALLEPAGVDKVKSITGGVTVTADVNVDVKVATDDADAAKALNGTIADGLKQAQDIAALIALQQKELAPIVDILNSIKHDSKDASIGIKSEIKGETVEKLVKGLKELAEKNGLK